MYVAIGALVILILVLIVVGVSLSKLQSLDQFPPTQSVCPDHWDISSNPLYCGFPTESTSLNRGSITTNSLNSIDQTSRNNIGMFTGSGFGGKTSGTLFDVKSKSGTSIFQYMQLNDNTNLTNLYPGSTERCAKKKWANTLGITWDGVSNFNGC